MPFQLKPAEALPTEFRIFAPGERFSSAGAEVTYDPIVIKLEDEDKPITREPMSGEPIDVMGWFKVKASSDGIWATEIRWNISATAAREAGAYLVPICRVTVDKPFRVVDVIGLFPTHVPAERMTPERTTLNQSEDLDERQKVEQDRLIYGVGFLLDGKRVDPTRLVMVGVNAPVEELQAQLKEAKAIGLAMEKSRDQACIEEARVVEERDAARRQVAELSEEVERVRTELAASRRRFLPGIVLPNTGGLAEAVQATRDAQNRAAVVDVAFPPTELSTAGLFDEHINELSKELVRRRDAEMLANVAHPGSSAPTLEEVEAAPHAFWLDESARIHRRSECEALGCNPPPRCVPPPIRPGENQGG